jgi:FG-GAP-like repeat/FG-GAP repeat
MNCIVHLLLICFLFIAQPAPAQDLFSRRTDLITEEGPISICFGDFNKDGELDLAVANYKSNSVSILLNRTAPGDSAPSFSPKMDIETGERPMSVSVGDFNGDGKPDLVVANYNSNTVSVFLNTTNPGAATSTFSKRIDFPAGERPISVSVADFNGDGKPDFAVANYKSNTISVFLNMTTQGSATPAFSTKIDFTTGVRPVSLATGDLNADGRPDIAVANYRTNTISIFMNTTVRNATTISFSTKADFSTGERPMSVSVGDLNGDGRPDIVVGNYGANTVSVLFNTTSRDAITPSFQTKTDFITGSNPQSICIVDIDGDGKPDLAVANYSAGTVSIFSNATDRGPATPSFSIKKDIITGIAPCSVSSGDLHGQERPDLGVANYGSNTVSIFFNLTSLRRLSPK